MARLVKKRTHREFVVVNDEDRYFDGNDSGELTIDEFVTLNSVTLVGTIYGSGSSLTLTNVVEVSQATYPKNRIQVFRGSFPVLSGLYYDRFPAGRGNILINADWGYGAAIPEDLWGAVRDEVVFRLIAEIVSAADSGVSGMLMKSWEVADESEAYDTSKIPGEYLKGHERFLQALIDYKRPARKVVARAWTPSVI